eukprot:CFRG3820T1
MFATKWMLLFLFVVFCCVTQSRVGVAGDNLEGYLEDEEFDQLVNIEVERLLADKRLQAVQRKAQEELETGDESVPVQPFHSDIAKTPTRYTNIHKHSDHPNALEDSSQQDVILEASKRANEKLILRAVRKHMKEEEMREERAKKLVDNVRSEFVEQERIRQLVNTVYFSEGQRQRQQQAAQYYTTDCDDVEYKLKGVQRALASAKQKIEDMRSSVSAWEDKLIAANETILTLDSTRVEAEELHVKCESLRVDLLARVVALENEASLEREGNRNLTHWIEQLNQNVKEEMEECARKAKEMQDNLKEKEARLITSEAKFKSFVNEHEHALSKEAEKLNAKDHALKSMETEVEIMTTELKASQIKLTACKQQLAGFQGDIDDDCAPEVLKRRENEMVAMKTSVLQLQSSLNDQTLALQTREIELEEKESAFEKKKLEISDMENAILMMNGTAKVANGGVGLGEDALYSDGDCGDECMCDCECKTLENTLDETEKRVSIMENNAQNCADELHVAESTRELLNEKLAQCETEVTAGIPLYLLAPTVLFASDDYMDILMKLTVLLAFMLTPILLLLLACRGGGSGYSVERVDQLVQEKVADNNKLMEQQYRDQMNVITKEKANAIDRMKDAVAQADKFRVEWLKMVKEKEARDKKISEMKERMLNMQTTHTDLKTRYETLRHELSAVKDSQSDMHNALQRENDSLTRDLNEAKLTCDELSSQIDGLKESNQKARTETQSLAEMISKAEETSGSSLAESNAVIAVVTSEKLNMQKQIAVLRAQATELQTKLVVAMSGQEIENDGEGGFCIKTLEESFTAERTAMQADLTRLEEETQRAIKSLASSLASAAESKSAVEKRLTENVCERDRLQYKLEDKEKELVLAEKKISTLKVFFETETSDLRSKGEKDVQDLEETRLKLKACMDVIERTRADLKEAQQRVSELESLVKEQGNESIVLGRRPSDSGGRTGSREAKGSRDGDISASMLNSTSCRGASSSVVSGNDDFGIGMRGVEFETNGFDDLRLPTAEEVGTQQRNLVSINNAPPDMMNEEDLSQFGLPSKHQTAIQESVNTDSSMYNNMPPTLDGAMGMVRKTHASKHASVRASGVKVVDEGGRQSRLENIGDNNLTPHLQSHISQPPLTATLSSADPQPYNPQMGGLPPGPPVMGMPPPAHNDGSAMSSHQMQHEQVMHETQLSSGGNDGSTSYNGNDTMEGAVTSDGVDESLFTPLSPVPITSPAGPQPLPSFFDPSRFSQKAPKAFGAMKVPESADLRSNNNTNIMHTNNGTIDDEEDLMSFTRKPKKGDF